MPKKGNTFELFMTSIRLGALVTVLLFGESAIDGINE